MYILFRKSLLLSGLLLASNTLFAGINPLEKVFICYDAGERGLPAPLDYKFTVSNKTDADQPIVGKFLELQYAAGVPDVKCAAGSLTYSAQDVDGSKDLHQVDSSFSITVSGTLGTSYKSFGVRVSVQKTASGNYVFSIPAATRAAFSLCTGTGICGISSEQPIDSPLYIHVQTVNS